MRLGEAGRLLAAGLTLASVGIACARPDARPSPPGRPAAAAPGDPNRAPQPAGPAGSTGELAVKGWSDFLSPNYPYKMRLPSDWIRDVGSADASRSESERFLEPATRSDRRPAIVLVNARPLKGGETLADIARQREDGLNSQLSENRRFHGQKQAGNVQKSQLKVAGRDAWVFKSGEFVARTSASSYSYNTIEVNFMHEGRAWQIQLVTDPNTETDTRKVFDEVLKSFELTSTPTGDSLVYQSSRLPYAVTVPRDWTVKDDTLIIRSEQGFNSQLTVRMIPAKQLSVGRLADYRAILLKELGPGIDPKQRQTYVDIKIGEYPGEVILASRIAESRRADVEVYYFLTGGNIWELRFQTFPSITMDLAHRKNVARILSSFRLVK